MKTVADRHKLAAIITSTADKLHAGINIDDLERPWNRKIGVFSEFFVILGCEAHLRSEFSTELLEINEDNLSMKLNWCCRVEGCFTITR